MGLEKYFSIISMIALITSVGAGVVIFLHVVNFNNRINLITKELWELMRRQNSTPSEEDLIASIRAKIGEEIHTGIDWIPPQTQRECKKDNARFMIEILNRLLTEGEFYFRVGDVMKLPEREGKWTLGTNEHDEIIISNGKWTDNLGVKWNQGERIGARALAGRINCGNLPQLCVLAE